MAIKKIKYIFFCLSIVAFSSTFGQAIKSFSDDPIKFPEELETFFDAGVSPNLKKDAKDFIEDFQKFWKEGKFNEGQKQACYEMCNQMLKKKLRPLPDFQNFLACMMTLAGNPKFQNNFDAWLKSINQILSGKGIKYITEYLSMSQNLFLDNTFYNTAVAKWKSDNSDFKFEFDSVAKVVFPKLTLRGYGSQKDSTIIFNTSGTYYPSIGKFMGKGGKVTWERTGLDVNAVWAELKNYEIVLKSAGYKADSVTFYNKNYFNKPLLGELSEKALNENDDHRTYPRFESYSKRFQLNNLAENVEYDGGFSMRGPKFIGSGNKDEDAYVYFLREGKKFIVISSKIFNITKDKISSDNVVAKVYLDKDSIYHPGVSFKFQIAEKTLTLIRTEEGTGKTPFFDSYHVLDMYFEELVWKTNEPKIDFKMLPGSAAGEADFLSSNYFKEEMYSRLQGMSEVHPLIKIKDYVKSIGNQRTFEGKELARFMGASFNSIRPFYITLVTLGLISYDIEKDEITVKDRLFQFVSNRAGKSDYDVIDFHSATSGNNGSINLLNNDLKISGVQSITLSDSQNVVIYPKGREIIVKKNRDFDFSGHIKAGRFDFFGKQYTFKYDEFKINMPNVDSLLMMVQTFNPDDNGNYSLVRCKSNIQYLNGELLIDNPKNKSGVKSYAQYPVFNSFKDSYVFYNKRSIHNGVYKKDNFYFHLDPFSVDSLDNFTNKGINFKGEFASADIFPTFKESLTLQKDYSLGFIRETPSEGFQVYKGKGKYNNKISMSHEGLHGDGVLDYLTSTTKSNDFLFFPDSMNTFAQNFDIKERNDPKPQYPQVKGEDVYIHWVPYKDVMQVFKREKVFKCYNGQAEFTGRFDLSPKELAGRGVTEFKNSQLEARKIIFKQNEFDSDTADFRLKALDVAGLAFSTSNVKAHIDFNQRLGEFKSNGKGSIVKFPVNQYICYMEKFKWFMDKNDIELGGDLKNKSGQKATQADLDLEGPEFISVHNKQDSLRFFAPRAKYDLKNYIISAMDVPFINVADARIFPNKGNVTIKKDAVMQTLDTAKIIANTTTKYHNAYNATINIFARKNYSGSCYYDYVDELKAKQTIYFSHITVDTTYQTYAETEIKDTSKFTLSPYYEYKGKVRLEASSQFLKFGGAVRILHNCELVKRTWFKFNSEIDPNNIYIPVDSIPTDFNGDKLAASIMLTVDSTHLYSAFLSKRHMRSDVPVLPASGFLYFDKGTKEYRIASKEKLVERSFPGNYLSLKTQGCTIYGEGKINMGTELGQVKMDVVGYANHYLIPDSAIFNTMFTLDFFFDDNAMDKMSEAIIATPDLKPITFGQTYEKGLRELLGKEKADKLISQVNLYGQFKKFPDELKKSFFFTDVVMKWNTSTKSYLSVGKIGISNINKTQVNKYVNGRIELIRKKGGDILNVYLELDGSNWYFFSYTRGLMQSISSNDQFNNIIKELKADKREKKGEKGEGNYQFNLSTVSKKTSFLRKTEEGAE